MIDTKTTNQLDTVIQIVTPENISFNYQLASVSQRVIAYAFDLAIESGFLFLFGMAMGLARLYFFIPYGLLFGLYLFVIFLLFWFLGGILETVWNGQTIGKRLLGIRVLTIDGQPINSFQAIFRNILRSVDLQPIVFSSVAFATMLCTKRFQRFGDVVCGTMVIVDENPEGRRELVRFKHPEIHRIAEQIPPGLVLNGRIVKLLALYVHRRKAISPMRREHIASLLVEPLIECYDLPRNVHPDLQLCALYHSQFANRNEENKENNCA